ncbi:Ribitol kinase [Vibrio nigripulchritudo SFn27]|uniref:Ribitol kinase n=1 Tax=Vibrio nigripulchritudo TaxID=28173 RepID=U4KEB7_9VIBR|nr:FGGY-family carbohydrate kinase [Vibrio nigripulchritudo]CCN82988.1 Ribitol kinase [Vibrio nigripulchritudo BLFn1]CCN90744.1 Ribitol kinase [Vibrio nigripulchritudo SFn27]CCN97331.1 Ribitol kinase [Vibrio nigripulchritudo ENn2]CCO39967.1 Ribitol kinase [Vibrio nigripulchritudo SFn135]CCO51107.1 Ribitol kinase [Vibrio nigripulchritudo Wn13]
MPDNRYVIGVDVGTGSARAGLFDLKGKQIGSVKQDIVMFSEGNAHYEQSSDQIWESVGHCVRTVLSESGVSKDAVIGISFDATCSLVVIGENDQPLSVGTHGKSERNILVWMDQRATPQAKRINEQGHSVLEFVGNRISPEMQTPKLIWLKENLPDSYNKARYFFDLTDFLTWKSSGSLARSICTTVCKWTYLAHENRWDESYFREFGLDELADAGFSKIGTDIVAPGTALASGLTQDAAEHLGLNQGMAVAAGLIDAHAGGVGSVGALNEEGEADPSASLAYVFGTSACTMTSSPNQVLVPGVWGPYYSAMVPGMWLNEAGQSAAGAAIDHLVSLHPAYSELKAMANIDGKSPVHYLSEGVKSQITEWSDAVTMVEGMHVLPEFLGNRAPNADPDARAAILGLDMEHSIDNLQKLYVAGVCGLAYGLRQIIEAQEERGLSISQVVISGGAGQDPLIRQILADATGVKVVAPQAPEPVMLGSAILAAVAANAYPDMQEAMKGMSAFGESYTPADGRIKQVHEKRYQTYIKLQTLVRESRTF